jgi:phosphoribosyl 1,2-cyclic phosphate phosphodiesterase
VADIAMLIDTPEDIAVALNNADIKAVDAIAYSHWDPDHTLGMRIVEQLRLEWLDVYEDKVPESPITVYATVQTMADLNAIQNKFGSFLDYYEYVAHLIKRQVVNAPLEIGGIKITFVPVPENQGVSIFVFESAGKKLVYAPCDCTPFPENELFRGADVLIIGDTAFAGPGKNDREIAADYHEKMQLLSFAHVLEIKNKLGIGRLVVTHLEEDYGKTYDDYRAMEKQYDGVSFAYDGMEIIL